MNHKDWEKELSEYIDKTLKPKKPGIKNLDREIVIDFVRKLLDQRTKEVIDEIPITYEQYEDDKIAPVARFDLTELKQHLKDKYGI